MASRKARVSSLEENRLPASPSRASASVSLVSSVTAAPQSRSRRLGQAQRRPNTGPRVPSCVRSALKLDPTYTLSSLHHFRHDEEIVLARRCVGEDVLGDADVGQPVVP